MVLITFGGVSLFSVSELHRLQTEIRLVSVGYLSLSQTLATIEAYQTYQSRETDRLKDEPRSERQRELLKLTSSYLPNVMALNLATAQTRAAEVLSFAPDSELPWITDFQHRCDELTERFDVYRRSTKTLADLLDAKMPQREEIAQQLVHLQKQDTALLAAVRLLHGSIEARIHDRVRQAQARERNTTLAIIGLPLLAVATGLVAIGFAARSLRPIRALIDGVSRIRRGDFAASIGIAGDDEISILGREFDDMAMALKDRDNQLREKQEALLRAERLAAMGRVSAQVAHEVRNPLSSIGLNIEMLEEQISAAQFESEASRQEARALVASAIRELDRVTEITDDYLRLARLPVPVLKPEDIGAIVESVLGFSSEELERANIRVERHMPQMQLLVSADESQMRQVVMNLIRNAREAMPAGGVLTVSAKQTNQRIEVRFSDGGPGIAADVQMRLFEPFFTTKAGGTGLGLSIARQIVEEHSGQIEVEQSSPLGSTFLITLPALPS